MDEIYYHLYKEDVAVCWFSNEKSAREPSCNGSLAESWGRINYQIQTALGYQMG